MMEMAGQTQMNLGLLILEEMLSLMSHRSISIAMVMGLEITPMAINLIHVQACLELPLQIGSVA